MNLTKIFYIAAFLGHALCAACECFFFRRKCTEEARRAIVEFFKKTSFTMILCYVGQAVFSIAFFVAVVAGWTPLPRWSCVFNVLPLAILFSVCKVPGAGNVAGAVQFLGLLFIM